MSLAAWRTFQIAADTAAGAQALSTPVDGETIKAVAIEVCGGVAAGTRVDHARLGAGICDGSNVFAFSARSRDNQATSDCGRWRSSDNILEIINATANTADGIAAFDSFGTDVVNIDWTDPPATALLLNVTVFFGDLLQIAARVHAHSATANDPSSITGLSFGPNGLLVWSGEQRFVSPAAGANNWRWYHGIAYRDPYGEISQLTYGSGERDNLSIATGVGRIMRNDSILAPVFVDGTGSASFPGHVAVQSFNADGITVAPSANSINFESAYLLFNTGANRMFVGDYDLETATGGSGAAKKITTGWKPRSGRIVLGNVTVA